ncbi:cytochrome P450 [Streptomyces sp. NBC_01669]|uniref:cytochrome P450 n=1 Tax=Streptomyces sp. NBC_01669 TaxID=2975909 RepID=UPI0022508F24|nr:cytochrome P450 [Streptomyces sp. NBC_01669]MCX4538582.1 cytochrome P450 [Streptomyces sp. NBC_01669]
MRTLDPLPSTVTAELLGILRKHHLDFRRWSGQALQVASSEHRPALAALHGLLADLVAVRDQEDGRLSEEELVGTAMMLVVAGHDSTVNLLDNGVLALLQHPDQLRLLRERPELLPGAVEEFLRYDTSVERSTSRNASEDLELGGVPIPRGSMIVVALGSAGHDTPQAGGDDSAVLDVTRRGALGSHAPDAARPALLADDGYVSQVLSAQVTADIAHQMDPDPALRESPASVPALEAVAVAPRGTGCSGKSGRDWNTVT